MTTQEPNDYSLWREQRDAAMTTMTQAMQDAAPYHQAAGRLDEEIMALTGQAEYMEERGLDSGLAELQASIEARVQERAHCADRLEFYQLQETLASVELDRLQGETIGEGKE